MLIMGWLTPKYSHAREIKNLKEYYEERLKEKDRHHLEFVESLRGTQDVTLQALTQSVHNTEKLVGIVDELIDLSRVATPALVARQDVLEGRNET